MATKLSKQQYAELLQGCAETCSAPYCFLKAFLEAQHPDERILIQLKVMERMKWIWSKEADEDIGWNKTGQKWAEEGYAKIFAEVYNPELGFKGNFQLVIDAANKRKESKCEPLKPV